jgi:hypothetical protein
MSHNSFPWTLCQILSLEILPNFIYCIASKFYPWRFCLRHTTTLSVNAHWNRTHIDTGTGRCFPCTLPQLVYATSFNLLHITRYFPLIHSYSLFFFFRFNGCWQKKQNVPGNTLKDKNTSPSWSSSHKGSKQTLQLRYYGTIKMTAKCCSGKWHGG